MKVEIRKSAIKDLKKIPENIRNKIHKKIQILIDFPQVRNVKKLTNFEPAFRLRIGNYRVLFDVHQNTIIIGRILHRKKSYSK